MASIARQLAQNAGVIPVDIPFPVQGIDQSMPRSRQVGLTCTEAINVCAFPPFSDRQGGGKCEGSRRAWNQQFTSASGNNRILGMSSLTVATAAQLAAVLGQERMYPISNETPSPSSPQCWFIDGTTPAATLYGSVNETPCDFDTTYVRGVPANDTTSPNEITLTFGMSTPSDAPADGVSLRFTYQLVDPAGGDGTGGEGDVTCAAFIDVDILAGSSPQPVVVAFDNIELSEESGDWVTITRVLSPASIAAITALSPNWSQVSVRVRCHTQGLCLTDQFYVSHIEMVIQTGGGGPPPNDPTGFTGKILVLNRGRCRVAILPPDMGSETLPTEEVSNPSTTDLVNDAPSTSAFRGKWYVVDGIASQIITPSGINTGAGSAPAVANWDTSITAGSFPTRCRLTCVYSGRIVLARQEADTSIGQVANASIWYMSRVLDPLDWAYALDTAERPAETAAVAGTNEFLGQPADAITALIPFGDDYLIFGCSKSMWIMEGDPGSGGRIVNLSRNTGVLDSRSWCFDESGMLWFMGSSGLYTFSPGTGIRNVSGRKLYRVLDRINSRIVTVQMAYSAFRKEVMIFLTPKNAPALVTAQRDSYPIIKDGHGTHIKYDIARETPAPFFRTFPWSTMGPWSVLEIQGSTDDDRTYLMGGNDGYVRRPFEGGYIAGSQRYGTADDMLRDGAADTAGYKSAAITSSFRSAPIEWPGGVNEIQAVEIQATGTDNNLPLALPLGSVRWRVIDGDSPSEVTNKSHLLSAASGLWFENSDSGFQEPVGMSVSNGALQVSVAQPENTTQSWALDRITLFVRRGARRR